jgi:hypothetical protein
VKQRVQIRVEGYDPEHAHHPAFERLVWAAELDRSHSTAVLMRAHEAGEDDPVQPANLVVRRVIASQLAGRTDGDYDPTVDNEPAALDLRFIESACQKGPAIYQGAHVTTLPLTIGTAMKLS